MKRSGFCSMLVYIHEPTPKRVGVMVVFTSLFGGTWKWGGCLAVPGTREGFRHSVMGSRAVRVLTHAAHPCRSSCYSVQNVLSVPVEKLGLIMWSSTISLLPAVYWWHLHQRHRVWQKEQRAWSPVSEFESCYLASSFLSLQNLAALSVWLRFPTWEMEIIIPTCKSLH